MKTTNTHSTLGQEETRQNFTFFSLLGKRTQRKAFTLVELIIVITILAILATIAFVSFQGYSSKSRDSNRMATLKNIETGLRIFQAKSGTFPKPDNSITVTASGATIGYQGFAGENTIRAINMNQVPLDPIDNQKYVYATNEKTSKYQLMVFMEGQEHLVSMFPKTLAGDLKERYPLTLGDNLGIILKPDNTLVTENEIDITKTLTPYKAVFNDSVPIVGTGIVLHQLHPSYNCKRILELGGSKGDGLYAINPDGNGSFQVYCDMTTDGGGWTLVMQFASTGSVFGYDSPYWSNDENVGTPKSSLGDSDLRVHREKISGNTLKFCMDNGGKKCINKTYQGTLKTFSAQPTSQQIGYTYTGTGSQPKADEWISAFGLNSAGVLYCDGVIAQNYTKVRIGVNKNNSIPEGCNHSNDYAWGFGIINSYASKGEKGAGTTHTSAGPSVGEYSFAGFILVR